MEIQSDDESSHSKRKNQRAADSLFISRELGRKNGFVAEVVRLPTFREPAARILTNSATNFLVGLRSFCKPVLAPRELPDDKMILHGYRECRKMTG